MKKVNYKEIGKICAKQAYKYLKGEWYSDDTDDWKDTIFDGESYYVSPEEKSILGLPLDFDFERYVVNIEVYYGYNSESEVYYVL